MGLFSNKTVGLIKRAQAEQKKGQQDKSKPGHTHASDSKNQTAGGAIPTPNDVPNTASIGNMIRTGGRPEQSNNFINNKSQELGSELFEGQQMVEQRSQIQGVRSRPVPVPGQPGMDQDALSPMNQGFGKYKEGDLMDETDQEESMFRSTNSPNKPISGRKYNVENVSDIQKDKKGQFMTTLGDDEYYGMKSRPTSSRVTNYDQGRNAVRDTLRPITGRKFKKTY